MAIAHHDNLLAIWEVQLNDSTPPRIREVVDLLHLSSCSLELQIQLDLRQFKPLVTRCSYPSLKASRVTSGFISFSESNNGNQVNVVRDITTPYLLVLLNIPPGLLSSVSVSSTTAFTLRAISFHREPLSDSSDDLLLPSRSSEQ
jgi:hypothetical protein